MILPDFMRWIIVGGIVVLVVLGAAIYSIALRCAQYEHAWAGKTWGEQVFSVDRGLCIKHKSLFEF